MRDLLIRYLLGELNEVEQSHLEERLRQSPELRRELDYLRACFAPSDNAVQPDAGGPPSGLAQRTTEQVTHLSDDSPSGDSFDALASQGAVEPPVGSMSWSLADLSVAAGVFLAVSMLLLPALRGSRDATRRIDCVNNLRELGILSAQYAGNNFGHYPPVNVTDNAGIFASHLVDEGYISAEDLQRLLLCRASKEGDARAAGTFVIQIPSVEKLRTAHGAKLDEVLRNFVFSYAYRIGYVENNKYHCGNNRRKSCQPILADAPAFDVRGPRIVNHGGYGYNLLFSDGRVEFKRLVAIPGDSNLYLNLFEKAEAGRGRNDIVLSVSTATPGVEVSEANSD